MPLSKKHFAFIMTLLVILTLVLSTKKEEKNIPIGPREWLFEFQTESVRPIPAKEAPIPYIVEGYYSAFEKRMEYDGEFYGTTTCDTLIVTKEDNPLIQKMFQLIKNKNTVNKLTSGGKLQMNLEIGNLSKIFREKILSSTINYPIQVIVVEKESEGKGAPPCFSFVNILEVK